MLTDKTLDRLWRNTPTPEIDPIYQRFVEQMMERGIDTDGNFDWASGLARMAQLSFAAGFAAAWNEAREACDAVAKEDLPKSHWDLAQERRSLWHTACARIKERLTLGSER